MGMAKANLEVGKAEIQASSLIPNNAPVKIELNTRDFNKEAQGKTHSQSYSAVASGLATAAGMIIKYDELDKEKLDKVAAVIDYVADQVASKEVKRLFGDK